jgi:anhydro-N-acetylmuramic acid kinase
MGNLVIGLMSGTSLDGIDAALVEIEGKGMKTKVKTLHFLTIPFSDQLKKDLITCMDPVNSNVAEISSLNFTLGKLFADGAKKVCQAASVSIEKVDVIGSHGQTIYHIPVPYEKYVKSTLQIGEPAVIAYETGAIVISNFRSMDMAAGGDGAPLVPYTDFLLYQSKEKGRILQNIGGIGNATVLPKDSGLSDVFAFDTGPGNMIIDELCQIKKAAAFDHSGNWASKGTAHKEIVDQWMKMKYFSKSPPKSTGRELFGTAFTKHILHNYSHLSDDDLIATATYFTAKSIADSYEKYIFPRVNIDEIILGGGGSHNRCLIQMLKDLLPNQRILTQEDIGFSSDEKEAVAFAVLANETIHQQPSNVPGATGAREQVILGSITLPPKGDYKQILKGREHL